MTTVNREQTTMQALTPPHLVAVIGAGVREISLDARDPHRAGRGQLRQFGIAAPAPLPHASSLGIEDRIGRDRLRPAPSQSRVADHARRADIQPLALKRIRVARRARVMVEIVDRVHAAAGLPGAFVGSRAHQGDARVGQRDEGQRHKAVDVVADLSHRLVPLSLREGDDKGGRRSRDDVVTVHILDFDQRLSRRRQRRDHGERSETHGADGL